MIHIDFRLTAECLKAMRHQIDSDALESIVYGLADCYGMAYVAFQRDEFLRTSGVEPR